MSWPEVAEQVPMGDIGEECRDGDDENESDREHADNYDARGEW